MMNEREKASWSLSRSTLPGLWKDTGPYGGGRADKGSRRGSWMSIPSQGRTSTPIRWEWCIPATPARGIRSAGCVGWEDQEKLTEEAVLPVVSNLE